MCGNLFLQKKLLEDVEYDFFAQFHQKILSIITKLSLDIPLMLLVLLLNQLTEE